ncbi:MAG: sarcosine oxidase subunit gamma family protein [Alphaproteobacteria bacterium]
MGSAVARRGPLEGYESVFAGLAANALNVRAMPVAAQINLRGSANDVGAAVAAVFDGTDLAPRTNAVTHNGSVWTYGLGPDEWLLADFSGLTEGAHALAARLAGKPASVVDVSSNRIVLEIGGSNAPALFSSLWSLDLADLVPDRCAQTMLAKAQVLVHPVGDGPMYRVFVRTSFARYLADVIVDSAAFL